MVSDIDLSDGETSHVTVPPDLVEKLGGSEAPATHLAEKMLSDSRHKHRVETINLAARGYVKRKAITAKESVIAAAAALVAIECLGVGGPFGAGGIRRGQRRHPPFNQFGSGQALAHDGRAWTVALYAALPQLADGVMFAYVNGEFIATVTLAGKEKGSTRTVHLKNYVMASHLKMLARRGLGLSLDALPPEGPDEIEFAWDEAAWARAIEVTECVDNERTDEARES